MYKTKKTELMDTTLRDGEQTPGVSFNCKEKCIIAEKLNEIGIKRIEVASALVSENEKESVKRICNVAEKGNFLDSIEVLGFVDYNKSVDWIYETGCRTINLLCKGSPNHLEVQLGKNLEQHLEDIKKTVKYAKSKGMNVNAYLEAWSDGMNESEDYVFRMIEGLNRLHVKKIMLCDTLGILSPKKIFEYIKKTREKFKDADFDFHGHNDYGLAVANSLAAIEAGIDGIHVTVNSLGERAGNADLFQLVSILKDHYKIDIKINEKKYLELSELVERFSGIRVSSNRPIIGRHVFTQTAGVHAHGDKKGKLYISKLNPHRFGRDETEYALGKLSGRSNIENNLRSMGLPMDKELIKTVTNRVVELGEKKQFITREDLYYIVEDVLEKPEKQKIKIVDCEGTSSMREEAKSKVYLQCNGDLFIGSGKGDGSYDAFMNAVGKIMKKKKIKLPELLDYQINIPLGGKTSALTEARILWGYDGKRFVTRGISTDQFIAAVKATERMLNIVEGEIVKK